MYFYFWKKKCLSFFIWHKLNVCWTLAQTFHDWYLQFRDTLDTYRVAPYICDLRGGPCIARHKCNLYYWHYAWYGPLSSQIPVAKRFWKYPPPQLLFFQTKHNKTENLKFHFEKPVHYIGEPPVWPPLGDAHKSDKHLKIGSPVRFRKLPPHKNNLDNPKNPNISPKQRVRGSSTE